jgi:hypothetical protein
MEQMKVPEEMVVHIDSSDLNIPGSVNALQPVVFHDGNSYCCLLGPDPQAGIFGCGSTVIDALQDWDNHLKERLSSSDENDEVAQYVNDTMNASKNKIG